VVNGAFVASVRNLGYSRNAGEFVRKVFGELGSAGGHRAMAKAVVPADAYRRKFGELTADAVTPVILDQALQFLHETVAAEKKPREKETAAPRA
jgi:ascorbate-specific PTS system EIIC-type component UlaA